MSISLNSLYQQVPVTHHDGPCSIEAILKDIETKWHGLIQSPTVTLTVYIAPGLSDIHLPDPEPLRQGLTALLANAHQLTSMGRVHIHATLQPPLSPEQGPAIKIIVADTGAGIGPASLSALFQPGRRLAPLQNWVHKNKGGLNVISNPGCGSEFTLTFKPPAQSSLSGARVLIVDHQASSRSVINTLLSAQGCHCILANSGAQALNILETQAVDFILMDILMPGMSGIETTHAVRQSGHGYAQTPIIALTADLDPQNNAACMAAGANIFLTKPVLAKNLIEALKFLQRTEMGKVCEIKDKQIIAA